MKLTFHGAARTVTGSRHLVEANGTRFLLDCGLYQGPREQAYERNRRMPFDPGSIDFVLLSHAHIDHSGNLPRLVADGFSGPIHTTGATVDLAAIMLRDSAHIQEKDHEFLARRLRKKGTIAPEPLYTARDAEAAIGLLHGVPYGTPFRPAPGVTVVFRDAGHLLGSGVLEIDVAENGKTTRLVFSGDLGSAPRPILKDPEKVLSADVLILESTYGDRLHPSDKELDALLAEPVGRVLGRGGKIVVPAFAVGRSQTVVYYLSELIRAGRLPRVPVIIDSPLSVNATEVFARHPECFDDETLTRLSEGDDPFGFGMVRYVRDVAESKSLNDLSGPAVIISASGMCESGRILHHLTNTIEDPKNAVLIIGFQAEHTLGRRLVEGATQVRIFGEEMTRRAEVIVMNALSAHADQAELLAFALGMNHRPRETFLVHGEEPPARALAAKLAEKGLATHVPALGESFDV